MNKSFRKIFQQMIKFKYMKAITTFLFALSFILPLNLQAEYEMHIPNCTQKGVENCGGFLFDNETGDVLFIMEVMKSEVNHNAPISGTVTEVNISNDQEGVSPGTVAIVIE